MARLSRIRVYPIKSLDPHERESARVVENGGLAGDREFAVLDRDGEYVNGKRTADVHRLEATYADDLSRVRLRERDGPDPGGDSANAGSEFALRDADDHDDLRAFLADYFGHPAAIRRNRAGGMPDDANDAGPTVIATATIREIASWFDEISPESVRRRLRPNLEVEGVDPFWEDRLYGADGRVAFRIGSVRLRGTGPCRRCVVPTRDPWTGEETEGFRERLLERREATFPAWAPEERFETFYKVMVNTDVPESEWGESIAVGDEVEVLDGSG